ncbi:MAG TPA: AI-2E family transporter [Draconibacterium sp.]|nr:AI-2E family transporter [Draconibacterium sp.]
METSKKIYVLLVLITTVVVLIFAQSIIIPFILAVLFWYLIRVIKLIMTKAKLIARLPEWMLTIISSIFLLSILLMIINIITNNIQQLSDTLPVYLANINNITTGLNNQFNFDFNLAFRNFAKNLEFAGIFTGILTALTGIFSNAVTISLYLLFLILEEKMFPAKFKAMYASKSEYEKVKNIIGKIDKSIINYIALKTVISLITGVLSYFTLLFIGVDAPAFWAFLIFILNFIPNIGSLIATGFPAIFALLQFGEFKQGILVLTFVGSIQLVVGNFIEPRIMGNSLNISPLVVIITLVIWGVMWGITGMLLSVPITVILIIIMAEFPSTRRFAVLLSQDGKLNTIENEKI